MMLGQKKIDRGFAGILKKNSLKIFFRAKKKNETKKIHLSYYYIHQKCKQKPQQSNSFEASSS